MLRKTHGDVLQGYFRMERSGRAMGRDGASFTVELESGIAQASMGRASLPSMMPVSNRLGKRWTGAAIPGTPGRAGGWSPPGQTRTDMMSRALRPDLLPTRSPGLAAQLRSGEPRTGVSRRGGGAVTLAAQPRGNTQVWATQLSPGQVRLIGAGRALPDDVRRPLERFLGADFSAVRVHEGLAAGSIGAVAFTLGEAICFAPGRYDPRSRDGLRLLGHELAHVVQQRQGRVTNPFGGGIAIVQDPSLEAEADRVGHDVAERFGSAAQARPLIRTTRAGHCMQLMIEDVPKQRMVVGKRVTVEGMKSTGYIIGEVEGVGYMVGFSPEDTKGALYLEGSVEFAKLGISSLQFVNGLPAGPYLRVNSFAFARSKKHPIGSDSFGTCLGVVIHDRRQGAGALAHIDTDDLVGLEARTTRILETIIAMRKSLDPLYYADLEVMFFAGVGLMSKDEMEDRYAPFKQLVASKISRIGLAVEQVDYRFEPEVKKRVSMAVYAPATGELYLHPGWGSLDRDEDCFARIDYHDETDYEDQEAVKGRVQGGQIVIVEVVFDGDGKETCYKEYYRSGLSSGVWVGDGKGSMECKLVFPKK